jgi:hypothetical protein
MSYPEDVLPYLKRLRVRYQARAIPPEHRGGIRRVMGLHTIDIARTLLLQGERGRAVRLLCDPLCLLIPRYWLRVFAGAYMPASFRRRLIRLPNDSHRDAVEKRSQPGFTLSNRFESREHAQSTEKTPSVRGPPYETRSRTWPKIKKRVRIALD